MGILAIIILVGGILWTLVGALLTLLAWCFKDGVYQHQGSGDLRLVWELAAATLPGPIAIVIAIVMPAP